VAKNLALIEELVRNLDTQTSQVVIEARIVEARSTFVRQMGVQWGGTGFADADHGNPTGLAFPYNIGVGGGATDGRPPTAAWCPARARHRRRQPQLRRQPARGGGHRRRRRAGPDAGLGGRRLQPEPAPLGHGVERPGAHPVVAAHHHHGQHEASIEQGVAIPISVVSAQGVQTVFVDAKLDLTVKPHVTNEGTVMMDINVTRNEPDFVNTGARGDPTILKKEARPACWCATATPRSSAASTPATRASTTPRCPCSRTSPSWGSCSATAARTTTGPSSWSS
jgi:type IV pilus assembly protein PilQ